MTAESPKFKTGRNCSSPIRCESIGRCWEDLQLENAIAIKTEFRRPVQLDQVLLDSKCDHRQAREKRAQAVTFIRRTRIRFR